MAVSNMNKEREEIVLFAKQLGLNSKIDLFAFMTSMNIPHMENTNGIFFSISDIDGSTIQQIHSKVCELLKYETISNQQFESMGSVHQREEDEPEDVTDAEDTCADDVDARSDQSREGSRRSFEYDPELVKDINKSLQKHKKSIHGKYSLAKKKYNKQYTGEAKKIDSSNTDLSELVKEQYIL